MLPFSFMIFISLMFSSMRSPVLSFMFAPRLFPMPSPMLSPMLYPSPLSPCVMYLRLWNDCSFAVKVPPAMPVCMGQDVRLGKLVCVCDYDHADVGESHAGDVCVCGSRDVC